MRKPKISTKRVVGVTLAAVLAVAGTLVVANSSQAAATKLKLSPSTGPADNTATVIALNGKGFQDEDGNSLIQGAATAVQFNAAATCPATPGAPAAGSLQNATTISVVSATKILVTSPDVDYGASSAPKAYSVCVYNSGGTAVLASGKYTVYRPMTTSAVAPATGPSFGGTKVTVTGEYFTKKTTATIGGKALVSPKVTINASASDTISGTVPAGTGTTLPVVVKNEGGPVTAGTTFDYVGTVKVSPSVGKGTSGDVLTVTGSGFESEDFAGTAAGDARIALVGTGATITAGTTTMASLNLCTTVQVESDSQLTCKLAGAVTDGVYGVRLVKFHATAGTVDTLTAVSRGSAYTIADF